MNLVSDLAQTVASAFDFSVDKFPLSGPEGMKTPLYGLFRSDTSALVGRSSVTSQYVPHTTDDVVTLVEACSDVFGESEISCHFDNGHYVTIAPTRGERRAIYGTNDNIFPRVMIRAGYDGRAFNGTIGFYRDMCQNLAMLRSVSEMSVSIAHKGSLRDRMADLVDDFSRLDSSWQKLADVAAEMDSREVVLVDFLDAVYGQPNEDSQNSVTRHKNRTEQIVRRLLREHRLSGRPAIGDLATAKVSGWLAFNAVQGYTQHDATRKGKPSDFARILSASRDANVFTAEKYVLSA